MTLNLDGGDDDFDTLLPECQDSILDQPIAVTRFPTQGATRKTESRISLRQLAAEIEAARAVDKGGLPWFKLAQFGGHRTQKNCLRSDANVLRVTGVEADYDDGNISPAEAERRMREAGIAGLIYTTASHTEQAPRWRVFAPFAAAHEPETRTRYMERLNGVLGGTLDGSSFTLSQSYYGGNVDGRPLIETRLIDGRPIDQADHLDATALPKGKRRDDGQESARKDQTGSGALWDLAYSVYVAVGSREDFKAAVPLNERAADHVARQEKAGKGRGDRAIKRAWDDAKEKADERIERERGEFDDVPDLPTKPVAPAETLSLINPATWANLDVPERQWALPGWIPQGQATYLTGPGSAGKSLLSQQLATCIALGLPFLGIETTQANALYLTCEDDADELHRRQKAICDSLGVSVDQLSSRLFLASLAGDANTELCTFSDKGELRPTSRNASLKQAALSNAITFMALDNTAHLFSGNENVRHDVAAFVSLLNRLAMDIGGAVLFLGHPNKAGDSFSGSTAWENQVRSRLFLETPKEEDGSVVDRDCRVLSRQKANYARNGETISFRWHEWAFVNDCNLPWSESAAGRDAADDEVFLRCLDKGNAEQRTFSPYPSAPNYAPRSFVKMATASGITSKGFEAAMNRLLDAGRIMNGQPVYKRSNRSWATGLGRVSDAFD